ncbi:MULTISPECIES: lipopolysaccharide biosynthesis protein [Halocynthiibacter]|uniref:Oligosaccharide flippase family protein n=1 Tax=Halocynthiibacter halioticoli TaxID=2986804 RepID=A0AAE3J1P9_9RHOB|nr:MULTISPECIES: oligosaccharide flippase family protein [Halocynthiibacter]MCV6824506.1 oligosaccharide flippase family protein [Halocynthiibacter halioticoli]MCW4057507.1 oligosaccharide flippase family protein [Halocynthiibacter sp. SDUM655004]
MEFSIRKFIHSRSGSFEGVLKHIGILISANAIVALLGLCTLVVMTRSLGVVGLGLLALIEAYPRAVDLIFRFEPLQAVIRYGTKALERNDETALLRLIKWGTLLDFCGAAFAAVIALSTLSIANHWIDLPQDQLVLAYIFAATLFGYASTTSVAVLRLFSRFDLYAKVLVITAFARFLLAVVLWLLDAPFIAFFWLVVVDALLQHILPLIIGWSLIKKRINIPVHSVSMSGVLAENPGILRYIFNANANVLSRNSTKQLDIIILGGLVSPRDIGLYQIAKRVALSALRVSKPIQTVIFPKLAQLWEQGERTRLQRLVFRFHTLLLCLGAPVVLVFFFWGEKIIPTIFGAEFSDATPLLTIQLAASTVFMASSVFNSALLGIDQDRQLLMVTLTSSLVFLGGLFLFVPTFGIIAASWLTLVMNVIWSAGCYFFFIKRMRDSTRAS